jgi:hypothetical protein
MSMHPEIQVFQPTGWTSILTAKLATTVPDGGKGSFYNFLMGPFAEFDPAVAEREKDQIYNVGRQSIHVTPLRVRAG